MIRPARRRKLAQHIILGGLVASLLIGCRRPAGPVQKLAPDHLFRPTQKPVISSPACHDWDGDGRKEIAIGSWDGHFYLLNSQLNDLPGWPKYSRYGFFASPALADLTGDGLPEIVVSADWGKLYAWDSHGEKVPGFPVSLGYRSWASPAILPGPRIAIGGLHKMMVWDRYGRSVPGWPQPLPNWADATATVGPDLIVVTTLLIGTRNAGAICAWHEDGTPYPWSPFYLAMDSDSSPALGDLDRDGRLEIVVGDDQGLLHVLDLDGQELAGFPTQAQSLIEASPSLADLDEDGYLDIIVGSWDGHMYVWNHHGKLLPGWPQEANDQFISSAAIADIDGDDHLDVIAGSKDHRLYAWTASGRPLPGFPRDLGAQVFSSPWVGDLDDNGQADIVVGANNGIHLLRDVGPLGRVAWPKFHRDDRNTGYVP